MASTDSTSPAAALAALQQLVLFKLRSSLLALFFAAIFYGVAISLAARYFRRCVGRKDEPMFVRLYVLSMSGGGTAYLALQATMLYQLLTAVAMGKPPLPTELTVAETMEPWVCALFALGVESYYVYRAVRVTNHRVLRALAVVLAVGTLAAFVGYGVTNVRIRLGAVVPPKQALTYVFAAAWAFTIDGFLCAAILVYELVWKRRATVVKSSLVQQFVVVAMRSSGLVALMLVGTAVMVSLGYVIEKEVYVETGFAMARIFPFVSCCIVITCLLERSSLSKRYNNNTPTTTTALSLPHLAGGGGGGGAMHSSSPLPLSHPSLARPRFPSSSVVYTVSVLPVAEDEHDAGEGEDESEGEKEEEEKRAGGDVARRPLPC